MHRLALFLPLLLAACASQEEEMTPEQAARDVAMVEAANAAPPPLREVTPEPITFRDMEKHGLSGEGCNYAPGTSLGTRVIARAEDAWIKVEGEVERLAADPGASELPARSRSKYDGRVHSLRLAVEGAGEPAGQGGGKVNYRGTIDLRDSYGRSVYTGSGLVQCGA